VLAVETVIFKKLKMEDFHDEEKIIGIITRCCDGYYHRADCDDSHNGNGNGRLR